MLLDSAAPLWVNSGKDIWHALVPWANVCWVCLSLFK